MKKNTLLLSSILLSGILSATAQKIPSIGKTYKKDFLIGTALDAAQITGADRATMNVSKYQFTAITPENVMKSEEIHPEWNVYNWAIADKYVAGGIKNKQFVVAHTLIWHSQLAPFVKAITSKDSLLDFMQQHIVTVAGRYAGKIGSWDVVNEALNEDGTYRKSIFYNLIGEDFIVKAFQLAQKADPHAALFYNDYNIEEPSKRAGAVRIVKQLQTAGARIDGVGIQGHWHLDEVPYQHIEESLKTFGALGIKVAISELDISVLPNPKSFGGTADVNQNYAEDKVLNPYTAGLPDSIGNKLASQYVQLFRLFHKYRNVISRVTFWGTNDRQSWLNGFPVKGRTNHPLLFDRNNQPKKAFYALMQLSKEFSD